MPIFDELDQRLSIVPRWVILPTIQKQSVAEHCFNVERIATSIADNWFHIEPESETMWRISQWALHHDDDEAYTGDIPTTAKKWVTKTPVDQIGEKMIHQNDDQVKWIVKLADMMEAYWFLSRELRMGNKYVQVHHLELGQNTDEYAHSHFDDDIARHVSNWMIRVRTEVSQSYE